MEPPDGPEEDGRVLKFPTHFAKNAKWMGHGCDSFLEWLQGLALK
jgi:hypothetical protein